LPPHNHPGSSATAPVGSGGGGAIPTASNFTTIGGVPVTLTIAVDGSSAPFAIVQQTAIMQKIIRYE